MIESSVPGTRINLAAVESAEEALEQTTRQGVHPDVVFLDYMLPDVNGNVVCKTVRQNEKLSDMKILIVSGVVNRDEIDDLLSSGADDFIKKPFDVEELMARVSSLVEA